jgi:hypothetical protein
MSFISYTPEQSGNVIGVTGPNQTIQNIENIEGNLTADNFRNQGLELRNFKRGVVTPRVGSAKFVQIANTFNIATSVYNKYISPSHIIGPFTEYQQDILIECSFVFEVVVNVGGTALGEQYYPDLDFHLVYSNNSNLTSHTEIQATRRHYRSNRDKGMRRVAGSYGAAFAWKSSDWTSTQGLYFGIMVRDREDPNDDGHTYNLRVTQFTLTGREYYK